MTIALRAARAPAVALLLPFLLAGCTGLEPAVLSAGMSAAQTGGTFLSRGKAGSYELASYDDALQAVRNMGQACSFRFAGEHETPHGLVITLRDDLNRAVAVTIERRTATVTLIKADTGPLGSTGLASLVLKETVKALNQLRGQNDPDAPAP